MKSRGLTAEFYFPVQDNRGNSLSKERKAFVKFLATQYGGYTIKGQVKGFWVSDAGKEYHEEHVWIEVTSAKLTLPLIEALANEIKRSARQICAYIKVDGRAYLVG